MTPFVPQFTPEELRRGKEMMQRTTPADLELLYRQRKITLKDKVEALRTYGMLEREIAVRGEMAQEKAKTEAVGKLGGGGYTGAAVGELKYWVQGVLKEYQAGWDAVSRPEPSPMEAASGKKGPSKAEAMVHNLMTTLEFMKGLDLPGNIIERWALESGRSPGLARAANWAVWIPTNFFGVTSLLKAPLKAAGVAVRAERKLTGPVAAEVRAYMDFVADPVGYATKQALVMDKATALETAKEATKAVKGNIEKAVGTVAKAEGEAVLGGGEVGAKTAGTQAADQPAEGMVRYYRSDVPGAEKVGGTGWSTDVEYLRKKYGEPSHYIDVPKSSVNESGVIPTTTNFSLEQTKGAKPISGTGATGPAEGMVRLYRGETTKTASQLPDWIREGMKESGHTDAQGRWFTDRKDLAEWYVKDAGTESRIRTIDVTQKVADEFHVSKNPEALKFSADPQHEFFLPKEMAGQATEEGGVGLERFIFDSPEDVERMGIMQTLNFYDRRAQQFARKGTSHEATKAEAAASPASIEDIFNRKPGEPVSAAELERIANVHKQVKQGFEATLEEVVKNSEDVGAGKAPELVAAFRAHLQAIELTNPALLGGVGEAGRALEFTKTMQGLISESRLVDGVLKGLAPEALHTGTDEAVAMAATKLGLLTQEGRDTILKEAGKGHKPGIMRSLYKNILFMAPATDAANLTGSISMALAKLGEKTGQMVYKEGPSMAETGAMWSGFFESFTQIPRIWRQALERSGKNIEKFGLQGADDVIARYGTARKLAIEDELIGGFLESALVKAEATKQALGEGLKPGTAEFIAHRNGLLTDPLKLQGLIDNVAPDVGETLMHAPLSEMGEQAASWVRNSWVDWYLPIIKFPVNSLKVARDWTPGIQMLSKKFADEVAAGGAREVAARNRMTISWMMTNIAWNACKAGIMTGGGPVDPDLNKEWKAAGNVPYAIHGYPIRWAEPIGTWAGGVCDAAEVANQMDPGDVEDLMAGGALVLSRAIENNWAIRTLESVTNVVTNVKNAKTYEQGGTAAVKFALAPLATMVTLGPLGSKTREVLDPEVKDIRNDWTGLVDFYKAKVPGYSKDVAPRLNRSGNPVLIPPVLGQRQLTYILPSIRNVGEDEGDKVSKFLVKHEINLEDDWTHFGGSADPDSPLSTPSGQSPVKAPLTPNESHDWKKLSLQTATRVSTGKTWTETIEQLDNDPSFEALSQPKKQDKVAMLWARYKHQGGKLLKQANPEVAAKEAQAKAMTKMSRGKVPYTNVDDTEPTNEEAATPEPTPLTQEIYTPVDEPAVQATTPPEPVSPPQ